MYNIALSSIGTAVPPVCLTQNEAFDLVKKHYADVLKPRSVEIMRQVLAHKSIDTRYVAVSKKEDVLLLKTETIDERMERFTHWSVTLSAEACRKAMDACGINSSDIAGVVVHTCTGYLCPGIGTYLVEMLGLNADVRVYDLVGAGCGGAVPVLQLGAQTSTSLQGRPVLCVAVEICSATYQMADDAALLISNGIFGDGAAAAVVQGSDSGLDMLATASRFLPEYREDVRFYYKNGQLHNKLSPSLPSITGKVVAAFVKDFFVKQKLSLSDIGFWAIHPGGDKVLTSVKENLGLSESDCAISRDVLLRYGNMSSPTVLFELAEIMKKGVTSGTKGCMVAFGAGMSMHVQLFSVL